MNLVGKILTTLIFVMSVVYMGFAVSVYSTHKNWKEINTKAKEQRAVLERERGDLQAKLDAETQKLQAEKQAVEQRLGQLETARDQLKQELANLQMMVSTKEADLRQQTAAAATTATGLAATEQKVETLRNELQTARDEKQKLFKELETMTDQKNAFLADKVRLEEVNAKLADQYTKAKLVLDRNGLTPNADVAAVPPKIDGLVLAVGRDGFLEISLGSDDGLIQGHMLDVSRLEKYLGRIQIVQTAPDRAVARVLPEYLKGKIEKDDRVATRIN